MKPKTILIICFLGMFAPCSHAHYSSFENIPILFMEEEEKLPLKIKEININTGGKPNPRTLIPEVTLQGNTLHFITPCNGHTLRLVQNSNICYEVEITRNTLTIPTTFTGSYELQIVSGDIIFYTEVDL